MKITNNNIEEIINILNDAQSFRNNINIKIPAKIRYAIRVNEATLNGLYKTYVDERLSILEGYTKNGYVVIENERFKISPDHVQEVTKELNDLATIENDVEFHKVDKETMDAFLDTVELSVPEERMLLMFTE